MDLEGDYEFTKLPEIFVPIMHLILLIWKHSQYYNTPSKLVVLIREICNAIITRAMGYVSGKEIVGMIQSEQTGEAH